MGHGTRPDEECAALGNVLAPSALRSALDGLEVDVLSWDACSGGLSVNEWIGDCFANAAHAGSGVDIGDFARSLDPPSVAAPATRDVGRRERKIHVEEEPSPLSGLSLSGAAVDDPDAQEAVPWGRGPWNELLASRHDIAADDRRIPAWAKPPAMRPSTL
jgi:hypothetical protein